MKLYELTKQDLKNVNKLDQIEEIINTESKKLRNELYEDENKHELNLSSFRYGKLIYLYKNWRDAWKQFVYLSIIPLLLIRVFYDKSFNGVVSSICMLLTGIGMIILGLRGRTIKNRIKENFKKLGLDLDELE